MKIRIFTTLLLLAGIYPASAATISVDAADAEVITDNSGTPTLAGNSAGNNSLLPGAWYAGQNLHYVAPLQLPNLGPGTFSDVSLTVTSGGLLYSPTHNVDVYGISGTRATSATVLSDAAAGGTQGVLITNNFWTPSAAPANGTAYTTPTGSSAAFSSWLNTQYNGGANAGQFAFVRLSPDTLTPDAFTGFWVNSANSTSVPFLTYTFTPVPEPATALLATAALAGGLLQRRRRK